jgi:hypothetical protein
MVSHKAIRSVALWRMAMVGWVSARTGRAHHLISVTNCALGRRTFFRLTNQSPSLAR